MQIDLILSKTLGSVWFCYVHRTVQTLQYGITAKSAIGQKCKGQEVLISIMQRFLKMAEGASVADLFASIKFHQWISGFKSRVQKMHQQADTIMSKHYRRT